MNDIRFAQETDTHGRGRHTCTTRYRRRLFLAWTSLTPLLIALAFLR